MLGTWQVFFSLQRRLLRANKYYLSPPVYMHSELLCTVSLCLGLHVLHLYIANLEKFLYYYVIIMLLLCELIREAWGPITYVLGPKRNDTLLKGHP